MMLIAFLSLQCIWLLPYSAWLTFRLMLEEIDWSGRLVTLYAFTVVSLGCLASLAGTSK